MRDGSESESRRSLTRQDSLRFLWDPDSSIITPLHVCLIGRIRTRHRQADGPRTASAGLVAALDGMAPDVLLQRTESGEAYVNVHTVATPSGEIRGNFASGGPDDGGN